MEIPQSVAVEFVRWWCHLSAADGQGLLTDDFEFDSGLETIEREDFLLAWQYTGPMENLEVIEMWLFDNRATVMFEGTDSVTGMRHRCCWMVLFDGHRARRVRACIGRVPKDSEKPVWGSAAT